MALSIQPLTTVVVPWDVVIDAVISRSLVSNRITSPEVTRAPLPLGNDTLDVDTLVVEKVLWLVVAVVQLCVVSGEDEEDNVDDAVVVACVVVAGAGVDDDFVGNVEGGLQPAGCT